MRLSSASILFFLFVLTGLNSAAQTLIVQELCDLPSAVSETSGLENGPNGWFWTHNDSDSPEVLYCVDTLGNLQRTVTVVGDPNVDWEEIAKDNAGNLYIGNFGNNSLNRTDLHIVKIPSIDTCTSVAYVTDTIHFSYPDQYEFPPNGSYGNFDMEAMFWHQDLLHLFSKDRSNPSTGYTKHYTLPTLGETYSATLVDSFETGHTSFVLAVTAADISENGDEMVMLSADKIWLFSNFSGTDYFGGTAYSLNLEVFSQKEGICFRNGYMYISDEESFGLGGKLYRIHPALFVDVNEELDDNAVKAVYTENLTLDRIQLNGAKKANWKLYDLDGKLLKHGVSVGAIKREQLTPKTGVYVVRIKMDQRYRSMVVRL
jgi:hypothetical protein